MDKEYTGILNEKIVIHSGILAAPLSGAVTDPDEAIMERLKALFVHYEIDAREETAYFELALKLALDHVPGMQLLTYEQVSRAKGGRSKDWTFDPLVDLYVDVWELLDRGMTISAACQHLHKNCKRPLYGRVRPGTIRKRYYEAKDSPWIKVCLRAWAYQLSVDEGKYEPESNDSMLELTDIQRKIAQEFIDSET